MTPLMQRPAVSVLEMVGPDRVLVAAEGGAETLLSRPLRHGNLRPGIPRRGRTLRHRAWNASCARTSSSCSPRSSRRDLRGWRPDVQIAQARFDRDALQPSRVVPSVCLRPPKGILPATLPARKTLIAKAVANSLSKRGGVSTFFLSIKGPELLNKFVGETELIRDFARARALAAGDTPSSFSMRWCAIPHARHGVSDETMIVPQLLVEITASSLDNVVIIGSSNRADMIALPSCAPGALDVHVSGDRPTARARSTLLEFDARRHPHAAEVARAGGIDEAVADDAASGRRALLTTVTRRLRFSSRRW